MVLYHHNRRVTDKDMWVRSGVVDMLKLTMDFFVIVVDD